MPRTNATAVSPADVVRQLLVDLGACSDPGEAGTGTAAWPAYAAEPPDPDEAVTVRSTQGVDHAELLAPGGGAARHYGFQVRVRAATAAAGYAQAAAVLAALTAVHLRPVTVGGVEYLAHAVAGLGQPLPLGKEPSSSRWLHTLNGTIALTRAQ